jgi:hypothetical protein
MELTKKVKKTHTGSVAVQVDDGFHGVVGIGNLRVLLVQDGNFWFAQGIEIDYGTQGDSIDEAKENFEHGLAASIDLNLKIHGNIDPLLVPAPASVLIEAAHKKNSIEFYSQISVHEIVGAQAQESLPFSGIKFFKVHAVAASASSA